MVHTWLHIICGDVIRMRLNETARYKQFSRIGEKNMKDYFKPKKGKAEAICQKMIELAGNTTCRNIEM